MKRAYLYKGAAVTVGILTAALVLVPAAAGAAQTQGAASVPAGVTVLNPPAIPGVAPLPGPVVDPAPASDTMGILTVTPRQGVAGTPVTISGSGLAHNAAVELTWSTANATWEVQTEPDTVNYMGRTDSLYAVALDETRTNASGAFNVSLKAPADWGGIHDIYAVINGVEQAHGGFILLRTVTVSPTSGPVGTPITITYSGLGASLYTGGASLLWDNHYVGELMANWTRGTARAVIRATGPVGPHTIQIGNAISYLYLNVPQSPIPYTNGAEVTFTVTKDDGPPPASIDWPVNVPPTVSVRTTLEASGLAAGSKIAATLAQTSGPVDTGVALSGVWFHLERPRRPCLVHRRWQPCQLRQHVLGVRVGAAGHGQAVGWLAQHTHHSPRRPGWLARGTTRTRWPPAGPAPVLRRGEHRRQGSFLDCRERGPGFHDPPEGRGLDATRQHGRG